MTTSDSNKNVDVSVIVTFHAEGILAHTSLRSISESCRRARAAGIEVETILVLDNADSLTASSVIDNRDLFDRVTVLHVSNGDLASSRHSGIATSKGEFVCLVDGDDLISRDYVERHWDEAQRHSPNVILHPEIVVSFGMYNAFNWQVDQAGEYFNRASLLTVNPWISAVFARRSLFDSIPQQHMDTARTGFGFEDWCWNCETISQGMEHRLAWGTLYIYRRKYAGSMNESSRAAKAIMPPNSFFDSPLTLGQAGDRDTQ